MKRLLYFTALSLLLCATSCGVGSSDKENDNHIVEAEVVEPVYLYGIDIEGYDIQRDTVRSGETVGGILSRRGVSAYTVDRLDRVSKDIYPLRQIRAGNGYTTFMREEGDSLSSKCVLDYLVYHRNLVDYVVFGFRGDSVTIELGSRPVEVVRKQHEAVIT